MDGTQAQRILSQIEAFTYQRTDIDERRLGLIADNVEESITELAIDNAVGSKWHDGDEYKTLDYSRLVTLCIASINRLTQEVEDLKRIINGSSS